MTIFTAADRDRIDDPFLRRAVQERMNGGSLEACAERMGVSREQYDHALRRVRKILGINGNEVKPIALQGLLPEHLEKLKRGTRMYECVQLALQGKTRKEIAKTLHCATNAVSVAISNARDLLGLPRNSTTVHNGRIKPVYDGTRCECGLLLPCDSCPLTYGAATFYGQFTGAQSNLANVMSNERSKHDWTDEAKDEAKEQSE